MTDRWHQKRINRTCFEQTRTKIGSFPEATSGPIVVREMAFGDAAGVPSAVASSSPRRSLPLLSGG
jgi:hypothetical protein